MPLLTRHHGIVEAVVGEAGVAFKAGVAEGRILVAAEEEHIDTLAADKPRPLDCLLACRHE